MEAVPAVPDQLAGTLTCVNVARAAVLRKAASRGHAEWSVAKRRVPTARAKTQIGAIFLDRADSPGATSDNQRPDLVGEHLQRTCGVAARLELFACTINGRHAPNRRVHDGQRTKMVRGN